MSATGRGSVGCTSPNQGCESDDERGAAAIGLLFIPFFVITLILLLLAAVGSPQPADADNCTGVVASPAIGTGGKVDQPANSSTTPTTIAASPDQSAPPSCPGQDGDGIADDRTGTTNVPAGLIITGSEAGRIAVRFALAQLGKPYQWGAAGPASYDCSGLTMSAWKQAGQSLPHFTGAQVHSGVPVFGGLSGAVGGDLVFIPGSDGTIANPRHVGMVVGYILLGSRRHLWIVQAPHTGVPVRLIDAANWADQIAAIRHIA